MEQYKKVDQELSTQKNKFIETFKKDAESTVQFVKTHSDEINSKSVKKALKSLSKRKFKNIIGNIDNINHSEYSNQQYNINLRNRADELFDTLYHIFKLNMTISKILLNKKYSNKDKYNKIIHIKDGKKYIFNEEQVKEILANQKLNTYLYREFKDVLNQKGGSDDSDDTSTNSNNSECTLCQYEWMIFYLWYLEQSEIGPFVTDYLNILVTFLSYYDMFLNMISSLIVSPFRIATMGMLGPVYRIMIMFINGIGSSMLFMVNVSRKRLDLAYSNFIQTFPKLTTVIDFATTQLTNANYFLDRSQYYTNYINQNKQEITPIVDDYIQNIYKIYTDIMNTSVQQMEFMMNNMANFSNINIDFSPQISVEEWGYPYSTLSYIPGKTPLPPKNKPIFSKTKYDMVTTLLPGMDVSYMKCCSTWKAPKKI